jgi:glycosyltransferase involved in cell wall biosynthesis
MRLALIIPAYNEELCIQQVLQDFAKELPEAYFVVVDNNSKDRTQEIARKTLAELKLKGEVLFVARQGKAHAVREAFQRLDADIYLMVDADLTYAASDARALIQPIVEAQAQMTVGDRLSRGHYKNENKRAFHNFGNNLVRWAIRVLFHSKLQDVMSGYRAFSRTFVKNYPILAQGFDLETEMSIHAVSMGFPVVEIPIVYKDRPEGSFSKLNTFRDGLKVLYKILTLFIGTKPLAFFGALSFVFLLLTLVLGWAPLAEFFQTQFVKKIPSLVVASGSLILSLLSLSFGILLEAIRKHHFFDYQHRLLQFSAQNPFQAP